MGVGTCMGGGGHVVVGRKALVHAWGEGDMQ